MGSLFEQEVGAVVREFGAQGRGRDERVAAGAIVGGEHFQPAAQKVILEQEKSADELFVLRVRPCGRVPTVEQEELRDALQHTGLGEVVDDVLHGPALPAAGREMLKHSGGTENILSLENSNEGPEQAGSAQRWIFLQEELILFSHVVGSCDHSAFILSADTEVSFEWLNDTSKQDRGAFLLCGL